tara:strand:- start:183 stop:689 length:507 start_codon:yes stop_codon:yes gene_type:complete
MSLYDEISDLQIFNNCSKKEKKLLASLNYSIKKFKKGQLIIKQGSTYKSIYPVFLIIKGTVLIKKNGFRSPLAAISSGELFGELSFLSKRPRTTNVVAKEDVTVMKMDPDFFKSVTPQINDKIKNYIIETLIRRITRMNVSYSKLSKWSRSLCIKTGNDNLWTKWNQQ